MTLLFVVTLAVRLMVAGAMNVELLAGAVRATEGSAEAPG